MLGTITLTGKDKTKDMLKCKISYRLSMVLIMKLRICEKENCGFQFVER